jgi:hypothetical protein
MARQQQAGAAFLSVEVFQGFVVKHYTSPPVRTNGYGRSHSVFPLVLLHVALLEFLSGLLSRGALFGRYLP